MFWLFLLVIPFFFLIGVISFIHFIISSTKTKKINRSDYLKAVIPELLNIVARSPKKRVSELLHDYQHELNSKTKTEEVKEGVEVWNEDDSSPNDSKILATDVGVLWSNWYSNNSINLLLYIGAFLIVSSASIFVGFQWQEIGGGFKALLLSMITAAFFGFGVWFHRMPKIRNAGATFTAIGALLIPLSGFAWHNFVLKDAGIPLGFSWLVTSIITLGVYVILALFYRYNFYSYISSIGALSLVLSMVNLSGLNNEFYILGSILTSFALLITRIVIRVTKSNQVDLFDTPFEVVSNIILPVSLVYGFIVLAASGKVYTLESTISLFLASAFYFISYSFYGKILYLVISEILFPMSVIFLFNWQGTTMRPLYYVLNFLAFCDVFLAMWMYKNKRGEGGDASLIIGILISILVFVSSAALNSAATWDTTFFAMFCAFIGSMAAYFKREVRLSLITTIFIAISVFYLVEKSLQLSSVEFYLTIFYLLIGIGYYFLAFIHKEKKDFLTTFSISSVLFFALSLVFSQYQDNYFFTITLVSSGFAFLGAFLFAKYELIYIANILLSVSLFRGLNLFKVNHDYFPLFFSGLSYIFYFASFSKLRQMQEYFKNSAFLLAVVTPAVYGAYASPLNSSMEVYALISAYLATFMLGLEVFLRPVNNLGYFTSALGMVTFLWQIHYLGVKESQYYTIPLGIYFLVLAYTRRLIGDESNSQSLDLIGVAILILSSLLQSFGMSGSQYAFLLGLEGAVLTFMGISMSNKIYKYAGVFAIVASVISQTYEYVFSLPRWVVTGGAGLIFLVVAIYLLLRRKELSDS